MGIEVSIAQIIWCCLAFFFAGIVDSITGGGGLITIPVMLAVGIPVHFITGTNQCSAWLGTGVAAYKYARSEKIHYRSALMTIPFALAGSYLGARLNLILPESYLKIFMIAAIPVIAVFMLFNRKFGEENHADEYPVRALLIRSALIGIILGTYMGFYGPGAGLFFMLAYAAFLKLDLVRATGNTRFVIVIATAASVQTYAFSGAVIWKLVIAATVFNVIGSYLGAVLAIRKGARVIRPLMYIVLVLLILKLIIQGD